jgi:hypothetical protein
MTMKSSRADKKKRKRNEKAFRKWIQGSTPLVGKWRIKYEGQGYVEVRKRVRDKTHFLWSYGAGLFTMCLAFRPDYFRYANGKIYCNDKIRMQIMVDNKSIIHPEARAMHILVYGENP